MKTPESEHTHTHTIKEALMGFKLNSTDFEIVTSADEIYFHSKIRDGGRITGDVVHSV